MATTIKLKNGSGAPLAGDLVQGEPALDLTNKRLYTEDSGGTVIEVGTNPSTLTVDTTTLVVDATNNRVGVGTASPANTLDILGDTYSAAFYRNVDVTQTGPGGSFIQIGCRSGSSRVPGAAFGALLDNPATTGDAIIQTRTAGALTEKMRIDTSGNVGIGTTSPATFNAAQCNNLVVGTGSGAEGITVYSGTTSQGGLAFADGTSASDQYRGLIQYDHNSNNMLFWTNTSESMRIDSSGNVGIGVTPSSWSAAFDAIDLGPYASFSADNDTTFVTNNAYYNGTNWIYKNSNLAGRYRQQQGFHVWDTAVSGTAGGTLTWSEAMRIDTSGNLLVGKTAASGFTLGAEIKGDGTGQFTVNNNPPLYANRKSSDGAIINFAKDNTTVGAINTRASQLAIGCTNTGLEFNDANDAIIPADINANNTRDNAIDLGTSSVRFDDIYATNGTIQTSDANEKQDIEALSEAETRVAVAAKGLLRKFRWKSAVEEKGDDARVHFGVIAQDLQAAFVAEGLNAGRYGMFIHSTWTDEETGEERSRMGVRYSELLAFIIAAI